MKKSISLVFLSILLFSLTNLKASKYVAGDLSYTFLGGNTYFISFVFYNDCSSIAPPAKYPIHLHNISNSAFDFIDSLNLIPGTGQQVSIGCCFIPTTCNGGTAFGAREYIYNGQVQLPTSAIWKIEASGGSRTTANAVSSLNNGWHIEAVLNNQTVIGNSSPTFSNKPIVFCVTNHGFCFNNGALDSDGDSLSYSFSSPKQADTSNLIYNPPYSVSNFLMVDPLYGLTLDNVTGDICFTPTMNLTTVTGVRIDEWRSVNGVPVLIGTTYRDVFLKVITINNNKPVLAGMDTLNTHSYSLNDTIYSMQWYYGQVVDFDISGYDADTAMPGSCSNQANIFKIMWNNGIPTATFTTYYQDTDSAYAHFHWVPALSDISNIPHVFMATINDNACPYYGSNSYTYKVTIISDPTGIEERQKVKRIKVFPNPANSRLHFNGDIQVQTVKIYSSVSGLIRIIETNSNKGVIDVSNLPKGIYIIEFLDKETDDFRKFIKI